MEQFIIKSAITKTNGDYYAKDAISASGLKRIKVSPAHYRFAEPMKETDAIRFGRAYHSMILTPELFLTEFFIMNDLAIYQSLIDKGYKSPRSTKEYKEWSFAEALKAETKTIIDGDQYQKMTEMREAFMKHPYARTLITNGEAEVGYGGKIETLAGEIEVKLRPDYIKDNIIVDLKTTEDASVNGFARSAANYDYHIQAAFYVNMMKQTRDIETFFFIAQEKDKPYAVNVFEASDQFISQGRYEYELLLYLYKYCIDNDKWPSYEIFQQNKYGVNQLDLPSYAIKPIEYFTH